MLILSQISKFKFSGCWRIFLDPWDPWGQINSGDIRVLIFVLIFCVSSAALANFFTFMKMLSNVNFISMAIKKVFFFSHNFKVFKEINPLKYSIVKDSNADLTVGN